MASSTLLLYLSFFSLLLPSLFCCFLPPYAIPFFPYFLLLIAFCSSSRSHSPLHLAFIFHSLTLVPFLSLFPHPYLSAPFVVFFCFLFFFFSSFLSPFRFLNVCFFLADIFPSASPVYRLLVIPYPTSLFLASVINSVNSFPLLITYFVCFTCPFYALSLLFLSCRYPAYFIRSILVIFLAILSCSLCFTVFDFADLLSTFLSLLLYLPVANFCYFFPLS